VRIINLPAADREFARAVAHMVKKERRAQAARFIAQVDRAADLLAENPYLGTARKDGTRGLVLPGVPYTVYYVIRLDRIVVAAIAHHSRRDGYWRSRLRTIDPERWP
jgi:plasmid stabilization system protein ParE